MRNPFLAATSVLMPTAEAPVPVGAPGSTGGLNPLTSFRSNRAASLQRLDDTGLVFSIINTRAKRMSGVGWDLVRLERNGSSAQTLDDAEIFDRPHMVAQIWAKPNPFFNRTTFVQAWSTYWDLLGEAYIAPTFVGAIPVELWLLEPERMTPVPDPREYLLGWGYRTREGEIVPMQTPEVWQQRFPNPNDIYRGLGAVQAAAVDVEAGKKSAQWNLTFFANSAEPGAVVEVDEFLSTSEFDRLTAQLKGEHQGVRNAHKTLVLEKGKYNFRSPTQRDMQFIEGRAMTDEQVRQAFGISKTNLGLSEDVNRATADTARDIEAVDHTIPKLVELQTMLNQQFLPRFGTAASGLAFRFQNPRPDNVEAETTKQNANTQTFTALVNAGADPLAAAGALNLPEIAFTQPPTQIRRARLESTTGGEDEEIEIEEAEIVEDDEPAASTWADHIMALTDNEDPEPEGPTPELLTYQADFERALELLKAEFDTVTDAMIAALIIAVVAALASDDPAVALTEIRLGTSTAVATILKEATALAEQSVGRSRDELMAVDIEDPPETEPDTSTIRDEAVIAAALIAASLVSSGVNEAVRLRTVDTTPAAVGESVDEFLRGLTGASRNQQLATRLSSAQQQARLDTFEDAEATTEAGTMIVWQANETLDSNTCGPCKEVANRVFSTIAEARAAYPAGGFKSCDGRDRCRGTVIPIRVDNPIDQDG